MALKRPCKALVYSTRAEKEGRASPQLGTSTTELKFSPLDAFANGHERATDIDLGYK